MLILPVGPPGCGKTTLATWAATNNVLDPHAVVSPDDYRRIMTGTKADQSANSLVFEVVDTIVTARLSRRLDVWVDATNLIEPQRMKYVKLARLYNVPVTCIFFPMAEFVVRDRNLTRSDPVPEPVLDRMIQNWLPVRMGERLEADVVMSEYTYRKTATPQQPRKEVK